ncbi:MCE family protein [Nocardia carnea]|uniref:MCE family protein n=1 Tax=Nocardia carnea TaxID=37328 RepID=UPI002456A04D|nr:MCE family protein [Nocardia carnea]
MKRLARRIVLALIVLGVGFSGCASAPGLRTPDTTITARFANANGLYTGNAVSVLGMRVGEITEIRPGGTGVDIELRVDGAVRLPAEVMAVAISDSVLTDRRIELSPVYRGGPELPREAVLGPGRTRVPVEFDSLFAMVQKLANSLGGDGTGNGPVGDLLDLGTGVTAGHGEQMRTALGELSRALQLGSDQGTATREAVTAVVTNLDALVAVAARNDTTLREFGAGVHQLSDFLTAQGLGSGDTGTRLNRIITTVTELLQQNQGALGALAGNTNTISRALADYHVNIGEFLDVFPLVVDNAYNAIDQNAGALRVTFDLNKFLLDGQMVKEVCNLLHLTELGCDTGTMRDMGPDFGLTAILQALAEGQPR